MVLILKSLNIALEGLQNATNILQVMFFQGSELLNSAKEFNEL